MPSLTQLLAGHRRLLILDAASTRLQVGRLDVNAPPQWYAADAEAGSALFDGVAATLGGAAGSIATVGAFVFCEGPGSMLGIRTVAMAIRTWQTLAARPAYRYQSLAVAGCHARQIRPRPLNIIADARRETWHLQVMPDHGAPARLQRLAASALPAGELLTPENFRAWAPLPPGAVPCAYDLAQIFPTIAELDLFQLTDAPDAFQHEAPEYKKWSAQVHSVANATK